MKRAFPLFAIVFVGFLTISTTLIISTTITLNPSESVLPASTSFAKRLILFGLCMSMLPLGQFFGSPIIGGLSDRYGRKKILVIMLACITICYILVGGAVDHKRIYIFQFFLFLAGLFEGCVVLSQSVVADISRGKARNEGFGLIVAMKSAGYVFGPTLAVILSDRNLVSWFYYSTPYYVFSFLFLALMIWTIFS